MEGLGVLDGKLVQAEGLADLFQFGLVRLEHSEPDETAFGAASRGVLEWHSLFVLASAIFVEGAIDDHVIDPAPGRGGAHPGNELRPICRTLRTGYSSAIAQLGRNALGGCR